MNIHVILIASLIALFMLCIFLISEVFKQEKRASEYFIKNSDLITELRWRENTESALHSSVELLNNRIIELTHTNEKFTLEETNKINELNRCWEEKLEEAKKDSVHRSRTILRGKALEQFVAFSDECLSQFSPSDFRMLGSPIDMVIFDGASSIIDGEDGEVKIVFCDVKTGKSKLSKVQKAIQKAVEEKRIAWKTLEIKN